MSHFGAFVFSLAPGLRPIGHGSIKIHGDRPKGQGGAYATSRYRRGLRNWRAKIALLCAAICGPLILIGVAALVLWHHPLSWLAGALAGAGAAIWIAVRETPPHYVGSWREGAEGERRTEKALEPLEAAGWQVVHDVPQRFGNYDHIAVGRAGVFLLETKNLLGIVELRNGVPYLKRRLDPDAVTRQEQIGTRALAAAARLKEDIERRTGHRVWVQAVVVFWSDFPQGLVDEDRCVFVHGSRVRAWLQARPDRLAQVRVEEIAAGIANIAQETSGRYTEVGIAPFMPNSG